MTRDQGLSTFCQLEHYLKEIRLTTTPGNAMPNVEEIDGHKYAIGFDPASPGSDVSGVVAIDTQTGHCVWPDVRWCDVQAIFWAPWDPRPRGYVSARKKKTRRERRWRRRNRR